MSDWWLNESLLLATLAVVVGVALDIFGYIEEWREKTWAGIPRYKRIEIVGFAILVLGLIGEMTFSTIIHGRDVATLERVKGKKRRIRKSV
ncbi:MAG: hypothetical protein WDM89_22535 [Rhizomicrobium sp.]